MRRKVETRAPQAISTQSTLVDETRTYRFITPVFGGGVKVTKDNPDKPFDPVTSVRVPSIRGQLRFWWRAVNPQGCTTISQLRTAEALLFGGISERGGSVPKGVLSIRVDASTLTRSDRHVFQAVERTKGDPPKTVWVISSDKKLVDQLGPNMAESLGYGAFPLRDTRKIVHPSKPEHAVLHEYAGTFKLNFSFTDEYLPTWDQKKVQRGDQIAAALWAWAHFGGLGGRTRRGFGAIQQTSPGLLSLSEGWEHWALDSAPQVPWPHLRGPNSACVVESRTQDSGLQAQAFLLRALQELRQGSFKHQFGRNWRDHRDAGRSHWPEGDELRRLTGCHHPNHTPRAQMNGFLRHRFGLPIIFHFKDGPKPERQPSKDLDPPDAELVPAGKTRFASPLVLRPYAHQNGRETLYQPRAVRLYGEEPTTLVVKGKIPLTDIPIADADARLHPFRQINPDATDVIDLYLQLLKTR